MSILNILSKQGNDLQRLLKRMDMGSINGDELKERFLIHSLVEKNNKNILMDKALDLKARITGTRLFSLGENSDDGVTSIEANEIELNDEQIQCPDMDGFITRGDCLDYSGDEKNIENCKSCENYTINRKLLLPT